MEALFSRCLSIVLLLALSASLSAQSVPISLDDALYLANKNYPLLKRDCVVIQQQQILMHATRQPPRTEVFMTGWQVDPNDPMRGIHGVGFEQHVNLGNGRKAREERQRQRVRLGNALLSLRAIELKQQVGSAYFELLYAKDLRIYYQEKKALMEELEQLAQQRLDLGETSKIPVLSASGKAREAQLQRQRAEDTYELAYTIFNNWLYTDTAYTAAGIGLPGQPAAEEWYVSGGHPELLVEQQEVNLALAEVEETATERQPQLIFGGQVQMVDEDLPFIGYTLGMSLPLGQKSVKARIESAKAEVEKQRLELEAAGMELERERRRLLRALERESESLSYLEEELLPLAEEQITASRKAYSQGAVGYHDYLINLEQALDYRLQRLECLRRYHLLRMELEFLSGRR